MLYLGLFYKQQLARKHKRMKFEPSVWGPHYWFVLHSIAVSYPERPNEVIKKKYYRLIQDFPLYLPHTESSANFAELLEKYPVTPYLDTRMNFMKWTHFIHNKVNEQLEKPTISFYDALEMYYKNYTPKEFRDRKEQLMRERVVWLSIVVALLGVGIYYKMK